MSRVPSSDGVSIAVHDLAGVAGAPTLLLAHATGFHARAYLPMAAHLAPPYHVVGYDARGHGDTERPPDWAVDWMRYGDDAEAVAGAVSGPLVGFGHSMGGAALLMAAHRRPDRFEALVLYEPIVIPPRPDAAERPNALAVGARRRRATFPSIEDAVANFASKPPLNAFDPAALDAYVRYGVRPERDGVRLKCDPEHEARTFDQGGVHRTWDLLGDITLPVTVIGGRGGDGDDVPAAIAGPIAERLPRGRYVLEPSLDHFGPFTDPERVAELIRDAVTPPV